VMLWMGSVAINRVGLVNLATGAVTDLMEGTSARYTPGLIVAGAADGRLLAAPFDLAAGRLTGPAAVVLKDVQREGSNGTSQFAVSTTGTLVYLEGVGSTASVMWVDRSGNQTPVDSALTGVLQDVALSPDGTRLAVGRGEAGETSVWVEELATGALSRLSVDVTGADRPVWTPDGRNVVFLATRNGHRTSWMRRADGSDDLHPAIPGSMGLDEIRFDPLGRYTLLRSEGTAAGSRHILILENGRDTVPHILIRSRFDHFAPALSPDGQWLAYVSAEAGAPQVYVRPFPNVDSARFAISAGGGIEPLWSRDGKELFYRDARGGMMVITTGGPHRFQPGVPRLLFRSDGLAIQDFYRSYDVTADGKRFVMVKSGGSDADAFTIIFNWRQELAAGRAQGLGQHAP
jgi:eukaryotic-like serine/threonine-protein kinase